MAQKKKRYTLTGEDGAKVFRHASPFESFHSHSRLLVLILTSGAGWAGGAFDPLMM
jgi:hypothetical protein